MNLREDQKSTTEKKDQRMEEWWRYGGFGHGVEVHPFNIEDQVGGDGALLLLVDPDIAVLRGAVRFARLHHHLSANKQTN